MTALNTSEQPIAGRLLTQRALTRTHASDNRLVEGALHDLGKDRWALVVTYSSRFICESWGPLLSIE